MYLSKKSKIILLTAIPATAIVIAAAVTTPLVISNENKEINKLDANAQPKIISQNQVDELISKNIILFNPSHYSKDFFLKNIANQEIKVKQKIDEKEILVSMNSNDFLFELEVLNDNNEKVVLERFIESDKTWRGWWFDKSTNVQYKIISVNSNSSNGLLIELEKKFTKYEKKYLYEINNVFEFNDNELEQKKFFIKQASPKFKEFFNKGLANVGVNVENFDLSNIESSNLSFNTKDSNIISFAKNSNGKYNLNVPNNKSSFNWNNQPLEFEFSIENDSNNNKTIWDYSNAFPLNSKGEFDASKSKVFSYLLSIKDQLILPDLTDEEIKELGNNPNKEQIENKQIEKIIFNPAIDPNVTNAYNKKNPIPGYFALLIKVSLADISTYIVLWQNLYQSAQGSIVQKAPEIEYIVNPNAFPNLPTAQQIKDNPLEWLVPLTPLTNDLKYTISNVTIPTDDNENETKINVEVNIQSWENGPLSKIYSFEISNGILGKKEAEFNKQILNLLNNQTNNIDSITPVATIKNLSIDNLESKSVELNELIAQNNFEKFNEQVKLQLKPNTDFIKYIPTYVYFQNLEKNSIFIEYKVVSAKDETISSTIIKNVIVQINV